MLYSLILYIISLLVRPKPTYTFIKADIIKDSTIEDNTVKNANLLDAKKIEDSSIKGNVQSITNKLENVGVIPRIFVDLFVALLIYLLGWT